MSRFSRTYQYTAEFEARQMGFDFAVVARSVLEVVRSAKAALVKMARAFSQSLRPAPQFKKPHQLVLELDAIAQIPLFHCHQGV